MHDLKNIREEFPIFKHHPKLVYFDSAATTHKPRSVIQTISNFYEKENANIHRGIYPLASSATIRYENIRGRVAKFLNTTNPYNIIFTSGTTEGINLVAQSFLSPQLEEGDEVIISAMEHHANLIPWQIICKNKKANLRVIPINEQGELNMKAYRDMLNPKVKMVAITHISNSLGTINPIEEIIELARQNGSPVLLDAAQSAAHYDLDVQKLDVDFLTFSGHKIYGPTGIGILYGKEQYLNQMQPIRFGGSMIKDVTFESTEFAAVPQRFEAGTTNIVGVVGLCEAIHFLEGMDHTKVRNKLNEMTNVLIDKLLKINDLKIVGMPAQRSSIVSFYMEKIHPHDIATFLGAENIAVRAGHHCTQPIMDFYKIPATTRVSFSIYNQMEEIDYFVEKLKSVSQFFK